MNDQHLNFKEVGSLQELSWSIVHDSQSLQFEFAAIEWAIQFPFVTAKKT